MKASRTWRWLVIAGLLLVCLGLVQSSTGAAQTGALAPLQLASPMGDVSGAIDTDTVWTAAESPYVVIGDVTVNSDVTLTIEPGVEVRFDGNYALIVQGRLIAEGTEADPILFTSNATTPAPGDWAFLDFRADSADSVLVHAVVEYGGNDSRAGAGCAHGAICVSTSSFLLDSSVVQHNATRGLVLVQSDAIIRQNSFDDHVDEAIRLHTCNHAIGPCRPEIISNQFTANASAINRTSPQDPYLTGNTATGNDLNAYVLSSCVFMGENTWYADLPHVIDWCAIGGYGATSVTMEPGAVVKVDGGGLEIKFGAAVTATGTVENPITFTSLRDDSVGGDTNNDGASTTPDANDYHHVLVTGAGTRALFEHGVFRYGSAALSGVGPLLWIDYDATATVRDCNFGQAEVGITLQRGSSALVEDSVFSDLLALGVDAGSEGTVAIRNNAFSGMEAGVSARLGAPVVEENSFETATVGVRVPGGNPIVRNNRFEGNTTAVHVTCFGCGPVVSPGNRFVGVEQQGIIVDKPDDVCVDAGDNWWADASGPNDPSAALDACLDLIDNPGTGAYASDGVDYLPWQGGLARPLIARPGCGVTARTQPEFVGRSQDGATITFYDGDTLLGTTIAVADDTFTWTPTEPLTEGPHIITAQASLGDESSLPSPGLPLTVDSTLPFDPAGVRIIYSYHSVLYSQPLRDASGCASPTGDLSTPVWIRAGSVISIVVPINTAIVTEESAVTDLAPATQSLPGEAAAQAAPSSIQAGPDVTFFNFYEGSKVVGYRLAQRYLGSTRDRRLYTDYGAVQPFSDPVAAGDSVDFTLPDETKIYDVEYVDAQGRTIHRQEAGPDDALVGTHYSSNLGLGRVTIKDSSGNSWDRVYFARHRKDDDWAPDEDYYGGNMLPHLEIIGPNKERSFYLPRAGGPHNILLRDYNGMVAIRQIEWTGDGWSPSTLELKQPYGVPFTFTNVMTDTMVTELHLYSYPPGADTRLGHGETVDVLPFIFEQGLDPDDEVIIDLEPGYYHFKAVTSADEEIHLKMGVGGLDQHWDIKRCKKPGSVRNGTQQWPLQPGSGERGAVRADSFVEYVAAGTAEAGELSIDICVGGETGQISTGGGEVLIDPDGYVYDAALGISAVIEGATVTCDLYDEDMLTWDRWPAELYESQINPQVTLADGYYAFFVPPGLYRVRAEASDYHPHTSPDIRVISEIVHYNIPLEAVGDDYFVYLPLVLRDP